MAAKDVIELQVSVADLEAAAREFDGPLLVEGFRRMPYERFAHRAGSSSRPAGM
jgi:hypothetical protein